MTAPPEALNDIAKPIHNTDYKNIPNILGNFYGKEGANVVKLALAGVTGVLSTLDWNKAGSWGSNISKKLGW